MGDGSEILFRNIVKFIQPNAGRTDFLSPTLTMNNGNVGIGMASPDRALMVSGVVVVGGGGDNTFHGTIRLDDLTALAADNGGGVTFGYTYSGSTQTYGPFIRGYKSTATSGEAGAGLKLGVRSNSGNPFTAMTIADNGNVLIGQTSQVNTAYKLDVAGYARANEIVVNTTGADFVFNPSYKLNSISSLKKYINKNHHLPEMPSAKQMQEEGLSVGENQVRLLQKVEELTLCLIEKDKQITDQHAINHSQQKEMNKLKKQILTLIKPKS